MFVPGDLIWMPAANKPTGGGSPANYQFGTARWRDPTAVVGNGNLTLLNCYEADASGNRVAGGDWETIVAQVDTAPAPDELIRKYLWESSTGNFIDWSGKTNPPELIGIIPGYSLRGAGYSPMIPDGSRYFLPCLPNVASGGAFFGTTATSFHVFDVDTPCLLKAIMISVGTGVGGATIRIGVYTARSGKPYKLLSSATVSAATSSSTPEWDLTSGGTVPGQLLIPGRYFIAFQCSSGSVNVNSVAGSTSGSTTLPALSLIGITTASSFSVGSNGLRCTTVGYSNGMPDPWVDALVDNSNATALPICKFKLDPI